MKKVVLMLIIVSQLVSCNSKKKENTTQITSEDIENVIEESDSLGQVTVYQGLLPCADCSGIETELKIYQGDGTIESHKFELTTVYKGKQPYKKFVDQGNYNLERGLGDDPDGTIYVLNDTKPKAEQVFYGYNASNPDKIYLLNNKREKIDSKIDYSLKLKKQQN